MGKPTEPYHLVWVESYRPDRRSGLHGEIHIRPTADSGFPTHLHVRCSKSLSRDYEPGTRFQIRAKLTDRESGGEFLHSDHRWAPLAIVRPDKKA
jgi:hypothetical protein